MLVGIFRLLERYLIILVFVLCSRFVKVYFDRVLGIGVMVLSIVVGLVFNVMEIGKCLFGCVVNYF